MTQTQRKPEITATAIYKVTTKATGLTCWAVPSDSSNEMYTCCWDEQATRWTCTCKGGQHGYTCKHVRAVQVSILAKKEQAKVEAQASTQPEQEVPAERADYLAQTHTTTTDTVQHIEAEQTAERQATFAALKQQYDFRSYDVVTEAQRIVNAEIVAQKVGDSYEQMHKETSDERETKRINFELSMGY